MKPIYTILLLFLLFSCSNYYEESIQGKWKLDSVLNKKTIKNVNDYTYFFKNSVVKVYDNLNNEIGDGFSYTLDYDKITIKDALDCGIKDNKYYFKMQDYLLIFYDYNNQSKEIYKFIKQ